MGAGRPWRQSDLQVAQSDSINSLSSQLPLQFMLCAMPLKRSSPRNSFAGDLVTYEVVDGYATLMGLVK